MSEPIVIIGAGQAGAKAAETLRRLGVDTPIVMYGDEGHLPYQRPPLSKKFFTGEMPENQLLLLQPEFYDKAGIEVVTGKRAVRLDPDHRSVEFADGTHAPFSKLLIATGSSARRLPVPGADRKGVFALRSISDVMAMREHLPGASRVVVVGAGYLGLEAASVMAGLGKDVVVLEAEDRILARVAGIAVSDYLAGLHAARGVGIRTRVRVSEITGAEINGTQRVGGVRLADGETLAADLVLCAVGGVANDGLAMASGLPVEDGVVVDATGATCRPGVYAAGDCARFPSRRYGRSIRLESVQNANDQARAVAEHMAGAGRDYDPVPWFWSDQFETKLQIAGLGQGHDKTVIEGDPDSHAFSVSYFRDGRLIAVDAINDGKAYMRARRALADDGTEAPARRAPASAA